MQTEIMLALQSCLNKDYSDKNQLKQIELLRLMLEINQEVIGRGISVLEDYESRTVIFPMLCRGLKLVKSGMEPQVIVSILLNTAFANDIDLLESLLVMEGVISIQMLQAPEVTRELLLSYFRFSLQDILRKKLNDLNINSSEPLSREEVEKLLEKQYL